MEFLRHSSSPSEVENLSVESSFLETTFVSLVEPRYQAPETRRIDMSKDRVISWGRRKVLRQSSSANRFLEGLPSLYTKRLDGFPGEPAHLRKKHTTAHIFGSARRVSTCKCTTRIEKWMRFYLDECAFMREISWGMKSGKQATQSQQFQQFAGRGIYKQTPQLTLQWTQGQDLWPKSSADIDHVWTVIK